jgi:hypothetical protein
LREQNARRLAVLLCNALERAGVRKGEAHKQAAKALARTGVFGTTPTPHALKHWEQRMQPPLTQADERVITAAIARCGRDSAAPNGLFHRPCAVLARSVCPRSPPVMGQVNVP